MQGFLVWCFMAAMAVLAGGCGASDSPEPIASSSLERQADPQEQTAAEQAASPQPQVSPEQQAAAEKLGLPEVVTNSIGMKLLLIPAGEFLMGSGESAEETARAFEGERGIAAWLEHESRQNQVRITDAFYLGVCEITQKQYDRVMGVNPSNFKGPRQPVEQVSWDEAVEFCRKLSVLPQEQTAKRVYRLPMEAEWEYACRAGSTTRFSYGDAPIALGDYAWFGENSSGTTHPVGEKQPNAWGLYDVHGNVFEWCSDGLGSLRAYRGGSWDRSAAWCLPAFGLYLYSFDSNCTLGFRVVSVPSSHLASPVGSAYGAESERR